VFTEVFTEVLDALTSDPRVFTEVFTEVLDALTSDPRVSTELAVNLVMALLRTGIDSVRSAARFFHHFAKAGGVM